MERIRILVMCGGKPDLQDVLQNYHAYPQAGGWEFDFLPPTNALAAWPSGVYPVIICSESRIDFIKRLVNSRQEGTCILVAGAKDFSIRERFKEEGVDYILSSQNTTRVQILRTLQEILLVPQAISS